VLYSYDDVTRCYEYVPPFVTVSLVQRYLIFQINVPKGGEFSIEIGSVIHRDRVSYPA